MFFLFPLLLIGMLLETLSVGMVIPAIGFALRAQLLTRLPMDTISIGIFRKSK